MAPKPVAFDDAIGPHVPPSLERVLLEGCRGRAASWPSSSGEDHNEFLAFTKRHGVQALLAHRLQGTGRFREWPLTVQVTLRDALCSAVAMEPVEQGEIARVTATLAAAGVRAVLFKGAAVAYGAYALPFLRPRQDNDVLVAADDVEAARAVLRTLSYRPVASTGGDLVVGQQDWIMRDDRGSVHLLDLHWRISNTQLFARAVPTEDLLARAVPVPELAERAMTLGLVDALLVACVHRVAHHTEGGRLIWLADLGYLAEQMAPEDWEDVVSRAHEWRVSAVCAEGLLQAMHWFSAPVPESVVARLRQTAHSEPPAARRFLGGRRTALGSLLSDLHALPGVTLKARLVLQHTFPSPAFLLHSYSTSRRSLLPFLYAHRLVRGA